MCAACFAVARAFVEEKVLRLSRSETAKGAGRFLYALVLGGLDMFLGVSCPIDERTTWPPFYFCYLYTW